MIIYLENQHNKQLPDPDQTTKVKKKNVLTSKTQLKAILNSENTDCNIKEVK